MEMLSLVIATGGFALLGALGGVSGVLSHRPVWGRAAAQLGMIGGCLCGAVLAVWLLRNPSSDPSSMRVIVWRVVSFRVPRPLALDFGFQATWISASLVSLVGGLILLAEWSFEIRNKVSLSNDAKLTSSLLYAAITSFLLAPNLAQSLLCWGAVSLWVITLIRLSRTKTQLARIDRTSSSKLLAMTLMQPVAFIGETQKTNSSASPEISSDNGTPAGQLLAHLLRRFSEPLERLWRGLIDTLPNWLGEELESLSDCSESVQILAAVSGSFAVMLTWLLTG